MNLSLMVPMLLGSPILIPRVLDVIKSQICYVVGTVYIDMPLKPNVLEDISRDVSITSCCHLRILSPCDPAIDSCTSFTR
jgi:hypothetical protein